MVAEQPAIHELLLQWDHNGKASSAKALLALFCCPLLSHSLFLQCECEIREWRKSVFVIKNQSSSIGYVCDEGVLFFTGQNQVGSTDKEQAIDEIQGWMLFFHPDLIRNTPLGKSIDKYHFFSYDVHEALHLSDKEQKTISDCVVKIQEEISERIDGHSNNVIVDLLSSSINK